MSKSKHYRELPFSLETPKADFYIYSNIAELSAKCELYKEELMRCRTIGILHSTNGRFYLSDVDTPCIKSDEPVIRISMIYLSTPPQSTLVPYPAQVFGTLQWKNKPVIYANIIQELTPPMALRLRDSMTAVSRVHLARPPDDEDMFSDDD